MFVLFLRADCAHLTVGQASGQRFFFFNLLNGIASLKSKTLLQLLHYKYSLIFQTPGKAINVITYFLNVAKPSV